LCAPPPFILQAADLSDLGRPFAEKDMFDEFECRCVYVEMHNDAVPNSGRIEYRASQCVVCQARSALLPPDGRAITAFDSQAPRYQRTH
jgi:hypothetical protein